MLTDVPVRAYGLGTSMAYLFGRKSWILSACPTGDQGNLEKGPHLISTIQLRNVPHLTASVRLNSRAACDLEISRKKTRRLLADLVRRPHVKKRIVRSSAAQEEQEERDTRTEECDNVPIRHILCYPKHT